MPQLNSTTTYTANSLPYTLTTTPWDSGTVLTVTVPSTSGTVCVPYTSVWPPYAPPAPEEPVVPNWKPKSHFVVRHGGAIVATEDSQEDAIAAAKRLAAKEDDEFFVYSPQAVARPATDVTVEKCA